MGKTMRRRWLKRWLAAWALTPVLAAGCAGKCGQCGSGGFIAEGPPRPPAMTYVYADGPVMDGSVSTAAEGSFLSVVDVPPSKASIMMTYKKPLPSPDEIKAVAMMAAAETHAGAKCAAEAHCASSITPVTHTRSMPNPNDAPAALQVEPNWVEPTTGEARKPYAQLDAQHANEEGKPAVVVTAPNGYAHAADFTWLAGELQFSKSKGWRLRYAGVDEADDHGGSVTLMDDNRLEALKDGQMVKVRGRVLPADGKSIAPPYKLEAVEGQ